MFLQPDMALITVLLVVALFVSNYQVSTHQSVEKNGLEE